MALLIERSPSLTLVVRVPHLSLLYEHETHRILINDLDTAIHDFWWALLHRTDAFLDILDEVPVSIDEWRRWRAIYRDPRSSRTRRGFAAFYLNRCNRSGIIETGSVIGGLNQQGKWKIDARFNKEALRERLLRVAAHRDRISVSGIDGIEFMNEADPAEVLFFIDPPYYEKGPTLYMNGLDPIYHENLAERLRAMGDDAWVLTYDDCPQVRALYEGWASIRPFNLRYAAARRRRGGEVLVTPKWMQLPISQGSAAITW